MSEAKILRKNTELLITVGVELTAAEVASAQVQLKSEISKGVGSIVVDMNDTVLLDSAGVCLLVAIHNSLAAVKGSMRTINASADIIGLLKGMRLADILKVSLKEREVLNG